MSVNKDIFVPDRDFNYDFQQIGKTGSEWAESTHVPESLVPTHCSFCGVQCGMNLRVENGKVVGVEPRNYAHNRGSLCPKGVVAYQQANHPDRLLYPMIRRNGKLERGDRDEARPTSCRAGSRFRPSMGAMRSRSTAVRR
ncbi:MAG: hypothetical protein M9890_09465 [Thermomicrobiales bacterium]|nr:hypothetical protein [Thermomicrobiales bacterium]